jgi:predicted membrane-bound spermidine synthase
MMLELVAFRLYAPYFGYSIYVWGSMISVVMAALALGYAIGGWAADHSHTDVPLYGSILASAAYQLLVLLFVRPLLASLAQHGQSTGSILATLVIFAPPMTALAGVAPFVIRFLARVDRLGSVAGSVYGLSTFGGIAGILGTTFLLVPRFGTQRTLQAACVLSGVTGLTGLATRKRVALFAVVPLVAAISLVPAWTWPQGTIWVNESAYNLVRVVSKPPWLLLILNNESVTQTVQNQKTAWTGYIYDYFAVGPLLGPARNLLVLGMGGGGSIASTRIVAPKIAVDAVEIDDRVVQAAVRFFGLRPQENDVHIYIADARPWLAQNGTKYDIVHIDLYQGGPYIPFYLDTVEFFRLVHNHLSERGVVMMNVVDASLRQELLSATVATLKRVFPTVAVLSLRHGNYMILAFPQVRSVGSMRSELASVSPAAPAADLAHEAAADLAGFIPPAETPVFTDDLSPIEEITRRMLSHWGR